MNPEDAKDLIVQRIMDTIEEDLAIDSSSLNGTTSRKIHEYAESLARDLPASMAQRDFDFVSTISQDEQAVPWQRNKQVMPWDLRVREGTRFG